MFSKYNNDDKNEVLDLEIEALMEDKSEDCPTCQLGETFKENGGRETIRETSNYTVLQ